MHARHRSPGNGYRSSTPNSSRISPDASLRGAHSFHASSDYRSFNRPRPNSTPNSNSFQPPRKADIFVDAGRLAAEYLVSQGLLPPNVLSLPSSSSSSSKWSNGSFKRISRPQPQPQLPEPESFQLGQEVRTSALARLGNAVPDSAAGSTRRRFVGDEFGFRNNPRGRRRPQYRGGGYGSDWGREYSVSRSASFQDQDRLSDGDYYEPEDTVSDHQPSKDLAVKSGPFDSAASKAAAAPDSDDVDSKPTSSSSVAWNEPAEISQDHFLHDKTSELNDDAARAGKVEDDEIEKEENLNLTKDSEDYSSNNTSTDLLTICKFAKVPTRIRSSLTSKSPKLDPTPTTEVEQETTSATSSDRKMEIQLGEDSLPGSSSSHHRTHDLKRFNSEIHRAQSAENVGESDHLYNIQHIKCERSVSMPNRAFEYDSSADKENVRGEKRGFEEEDVLEGAKRPRDWPPSVVMEAGGCFDLSNLSEKNIGSYEDGKGGSSGDRVIVDVDDNDNESNNIVSNFQFSKDGGGGEPRRLDFSQEKQLFPSSFKICDLNLMEVSETHENRESDPVIMYRTLSERRREAKPVDVDLSMNNSNNVSGESSKRPSDHKEIEIIDLENDSAQEDKDLVMEDRKTETVYTDLEEIPNHARSTGGIPDTQDGYGLMISELLGNDFPNCSAVPEHINPMHNDIGLHNGEGAIGDDDSIYMSLGEIPLTFLRPWEQPPPQEYEKPF
ncbi:uncharacterized protein At4g26450 [Humulus lupulus]|uniref:uncharacterized protein At4g26450 n=1 Tax=Humulus lupulus TaxID=3486 RepID=UPI002B4020A6|nr:uncharacterized protein At4g26450 [Humulus lupulus]